MPRPRLALATAAMAATVACAATPTQTYPGPPLPRTEVALLLDSPEANVFAINGANSWGSSWTLMPGSHELWVRFQISTRAPGMNWSIWSYCRVVLEAVAGDDYVARVDFSKETAPGLREKVTMEMGIADREGVLRAIAGSCLPKRPRFNE